MDMATVKIMETQNIGDAGSVMLVPINVDVMIPGKIPKKLPNRYLVKGILIAPKCILTASPGRNEITRRKNERKNAFPLW